MKQILESYTYYNLWANKRIIEMLRENIGQIDAEVKSSFPTMRKTLHHIWGAEDLWHQRLCEAPKPQTPAWDFAGEFEDAIRRFLSVSEEFQKLVAGNDDAWLTATVNYKDIRGNAYSNQRWKMIHHCMNHSTYHRGQLVTMLRETGATKILSTDFIAYLREKEANQLL